MGTQSVHVQFFPLNLELIMLIAINLISILVDHQDSIHNIKMPFVIHMLSEDPHMGTVEMPTTSIKSGLAKPDQPDWLLRL